MGMRHLPESGKNRPVRITRGLLVLLLIALLLPMPALQAQEPEPDLDARVQTLLSSMTVEERVGQVFLVTFVGSNPALGSDIAKLIRQDHVGGVVLLASNSNFYNDPTTPRQVANLANSLQALAMNDGAAVPLFVAVDHEGDGYPYTRITGGTTPLPNPMTIGATWDPDNAQAVGQLAGRELAAMGINLLLGPVVDVLADPRPSGQGDIGTRTFGGDPFWVGEMGRAYIEGVHEGSAGRVATVAKHFPGHGGSDRLPDEEVATVDKSLEQLEQVELPPFFAVTHDSSGTGDDSAVTDALMSSHIRYRGFQGDIRALNGFADWRSTGLIVSDSLGVPAVRKYFDPTLTTFPHRRIAKEAFLAGNDLLLLSQFDLNNDWSQQFANIRDTIAFFQEEYRANPTFAARVDEAVAKILRLKLKLYPELTLDAVQVPADAAMQMCGLGSAVTQRIASQAVTLLYPDANALPAPPRRGEKILIFTDARPVRECFTDQCQPFSPLSQTAVEEAILRIYGPNGTGQVDPEDITSLPFGQLKSFLSGGELLYDVGTLLREADWVIFAPQDLNPVKGPNSDAVELFLNDGQTASYNARFVVLAFNAPYYLDTTEISKLSLYVAAYSKVEASIEAAVRVLFGELAPDGAPPVDVVGINYNLERQLSPDPSQILPLSQTAPAPDALLLPPVSIHLQAGPVLDRNGNPVPDGTQVTFYADYGNDIYVPPESAAVAHGLAEAIFTLNAPGQVRFRAESGDAIRSGSVSLTVQALPTNTPTSTATPLPTGRPSPTPSLTPSPTWTPAPAPTAGPLPPAGGPTRPVDGTDLLLASGATLLVAAVGYPLLARRRDRRAIAVRWLALAVIGGMAGYLLYALHLIRPEAWGVLPDAGWIPRAAVACLAAVGAIVSLGGMARAPGTQGKRRP